MTRTQIQLPDELYRRAKDLAARTEVSLAELTRRGLEYLIAVSPASGHPVAEWSLPAASPLGGRDPFDRPAWRERIHTERLQAAEGGAGYGNPDGNNAGRA
jgi:hypothetical protein